MEAGAIAGMSAQYDEQVKMLFSRKPFLARILMRTMREFEGMDASEVESCIEGEPDVGQSPVDPGFTNGGADVGCVLHGGPTEDSVPGEGRVFFDIKTYVNVPGEDGLIRVTVNVEAQKKARPGYEIVTRGVFYAARLISSQLGVEFVHSDYDSLKKVYSIWICMDAPMKIGNSIVSYRLQKEDLLGSVPDKPSAYDKLEVVIVALNRRAPKADVFTSMMNLVLSPEVPRTEKLRALEADYNMELTGDVAEGVNVMCNLSEGIAEMYMERGLQQGREQSMINLVMSNLSRGKSYEAIADFLNVSVDEVREIAEKAMALA